MRGESMYTDPNSRTLPTPLPPVPDRLIRRRSQEEGPSSTEIAIAEHVFGPDHELSDKEITLAAFVYAKGYSEGVESKGESDES